MTGSGSLLVVGLGPGPADWLTAEAALALESATDIVGYQSYVARVAVRSDQRRHVSDNRDEIDRARHALCILHPRDTTSRSYPAAIPAYLLAAAAVFEALEQGDPSWRGLDIRVLPGISAMQAAAARLGAPLGHDFCAISLSDNLPWAIELRLSLPREGDFVIATGNPLSRYARSARPMMFAICAAARRRGLRWRSRVAEGVMSTSR